jgi:hypothetical protein
MLSESPQLTIPCVRCTLYLKAFMEVIRYSTLVLLKTTGNGLKMFLGMNGR